MVRTMLRESHVKAVLMAAAGLAFAMNGIAVDAREKTRAEDPAAARSTAEAPSKLEFYPKPVADPTERRIRAGRQAANKKLIRLSAVEFDPIADGQLKLDRFLPEGPALRPPDAGLGATFLIQFDTSVTAKIQRGLMDQGVEILSYVPNRTLLVRLPSGVSLDALQTAPSKRFVGPFLPGFKISPELFRLINADAPEDPTIDLDVLLFKNEDPDSVSAAIRSRFDTAQIRFVKRYGLPQVTVTVAVGQLKLLVGALIRDPAVERVTRSYPLELHNDNSVWIGQSYDRDNGPAEAMEPDPKPYADTATIWNQGLTGEGQIVAIADTGIEHEMCFFSDPDHPIVPQAVGFSSPLTLDFDHRKILAINHYMGLPMPEISGTFRHGTHTAGTAAGDSLANPADGTSAGHDHGDGMAPGAKLIIEDIGDFLITNCVGGVSNFQVDSLLQQEYNAGARISTNSWGGGSGGNYGTGSQQVDTVVWENDDFLVFFSAGNNGELPVNFVSSNALCKNCISVGASETYSTTRDPENMAGFSSRGAGDGRYKPDLTAPGVAVISSRFDVETCFTENPCGIDNTCTNDPATSCDSDADCSLPDCETGCFPYQEGIQDMCIPLGGGLCSRVDTSDLCGAHLANGTSMSSPTAAGLGALARQYFVEGFYPSGTKNPADSLNPSAQLVKAIMLNGARNMTGNEVFKNPETTPEPLEDAPGNVQGWGRIMLDDPLYFAGDDRRLRIQEMPTAGGLTTGNSVTSHFELASSAEPLKLTLAWTDPPGSSSSSAALINNLDLVLTAPDGTVYRGNQWTTDDVNVLGDKQSQPNPGSSDSINNIEGILLPSPQVGTYEIAVAGTDIPGGQSVFTQGFALVTTGDVGDCPTVASTTLDLTGVGSLQVDLAWDPVAGAQGYNVYRNGSGCTVPQSADLVVPVDAGQTTLSDTSAQPETFYTYTVRAVMSSGGCENLDSNCIVATTLPPPTIDSVSPRSGINNDPTPLQITGNGFRADSRIYLGTAQDPEKHELIATLVSASELQAVAPVNLFSQSYDIKVLNDLDGLEATLADAFLVGAPIQVNTAFVANFGPLGDSDDFISVIDLEQFAVTGEIPTGNDTQNVGVALANQGTGIVASEILGAIFRARLFSPGAGQLLDKHFAVGGVPVGIVGHPDGSKAYVLSHGGPAGAPGKVAVIDVVTESVDALITVGHIWHNIPGPLGADDIEIAPNGAYVYTTSSVDDTVTVIRTSDNTVVATVPVGESPRGLVATSTRLFTADHDSDTLSVLETTFFSVVATIDVGFGSTSGTKPKSLAVSPDQRTVYIGFENGGLAAINTTTLSIVNSSIIFSHFWKLEYNRTLDKLFGLRRGLPRIVRIDPVTLAQEDYIDLPVPSDLEFLDAEPIAIDAIDPTESCLIGNYFVAVQGNGFQGVVRDDSGAVVQVGTRVFFGGQESADVVLADSQLLYARVPASESFPGTVDVDVLNPNGDTATLPDGLRYVTCGGGGEDPSGIEVPCNPCHVAPQP